MTSHRRRQFRRAACIAACIAGASLTAGSTTVAAQGLTTATIRGTVRAPSGEAVGSTVVRVSNRLTGYTDETRTRNGFFSFQGLEIGGPYAIDVLHIGFAQQKRTDIYLRLGERRDEDFTLIPLAVRLETLIIASAKNAAATVRGGVGMSISDSTLRRLPTLNGDIYDFIRVVPQVGTRFGLSGAGASFRLNDYVIDGVSDRGLQGNNTPAKSISLDAVKEYQVLLAPFDARYGDFTGLVVNVVTNSGTNEWHGSTYGYFRNAALARSGSFAGTSEYDRGLYGFSLGGPIVRDRVHLFVAPEIQRGMAPARGPYFGQSSDAGSQLPPIADVDTFASLLRAKGLDPGGGGRVMLPNNSVSVFGRLDIALPELASRLVVRANSNRMRFSQFQRSENTGLFSLTSVAGTTRTAKHTTAVQLFTRLSPVVFNELQVGYTENPISGGTPTMPSVSVAVGKFVLNAGPGAAGGTGSKGFTTEIGDHVVFQPTPGHTLAFGGHVEFFNYSVTGYRNRFGSWAFQSLDSLAAGRPSMLTLGKDYRSAAAPVVGAAPSVYVSDDWRVSDRLVVTIGLRADGLAFTRRPAYNPDVDAIFHRRTSDFPAFRPQWAPRLGFRWVSQDDRTNIHGGGGVFVGRPPLGWLVSPMRLTGDGLRTLSCSGAGVPSFTPYPEPQPTTCANGAAPSVGPVTLVGRNLRMGESFRAALGVDRHLPWNLVGSVDALYSKVRSDFAFANLNLTGPVGSDANGRVMYGAFDASGVARAATIPGNPFTEVIDLRNVSGGYSWSLTTQLEKPWSNGLAIRASYTHARVRDVHSVTSSMVNLPAELWAAERPFSGRWDDLAIGTSSFEIPHRVVIAASYAAKWKRRTTDVSLYYIGESGTAFTYGDSTAGRMNGDLNADGAAADDPIYVPRDATNPAEIAFAGTPDSAALQGVAFERFIRDTPCLDRQRGRIVSRNSCRGPWVNTSNLSVRQSLPAIGGHAATVQLDVFNVLNLLKKSWGLLDVPKPWILQYAGRTTGAAPQHRFTFNEANTHTSLNIESGYQLQLSLRYSF